ncbi:hypothetical protein TNCV_1126291 [Trichonephila clavipes]|nr:hypothetical protein TNCV_1126291 [Trichonephila clavipes]
MDARARIFTDDKLATLTSLVKMWMPQQKVQCLLRFKKFKSVTRVQRRVLTEWNVDPPTSKSIHQWEKNFKGDGNFEFKAWLQWPSGHSHGLVAGVVGHSAIEDTPCKRADARQISQVLPLVWCGSSEREVPAHVSSSSLGHGSENRGSSQLHSSFCFFKIKMVGRSRKK